MPTKYEYLRQNSLKRDQSKSRRKKAFDVTEARKAREKRQEINLRNARGKGKRVQQSSEDDLEDEGYNYDDDEEEDDEMDVGSSVRRK